MSDAGELRLYDSAPSPNCYKVRLLLAQLELPYERVPIDIFAGGTLTDEYARVNPSRRTPVLEVGPDRHIPESGAILLHLAEGTPFLPEDPFERAQVYRWLLFEQSAVYPTVGGIRFLAGTGRMKPEDTPKGPSVDAMKVLEGHLADRKWMVGDAYGLADLALFGYVHVGHEGGLDMSRFPAVERWLDRVRATPRYMNDLEPFPEHAQVGQSRSIYD